ncbi:MAG: CBS domain-containing protein [Gammaproteobacteria bacterium]|nr:CBS domain-containing protein [Gammaproteobacteria bacterium]
MRVDGLDTVAEAFRRMYKADAQCMIVQRRDESDEFGLVLHTDIARKVIGPDRAPERVRLYEIMSKPTLSVHPGMNIRYAARLFERFHIRVAPVIEAGDVAGIVSDLDIVTQGLSQLIE